MVFHGTQINIWEETFSFCTCVLIVQDWNLGRVVRSPLCTSSRPAALPGSYPRSGRPFMHMQPGAPLYHCAAGAPQGLRRCCGCPPAPPPHWQMPSYTAATAALLPHRAADAPLWYCWVLPCAAGQLNVYKGAAALDRHVTAKPCERPFEFRPLGRMPVARSIRPPCRLHTMSSN